MAFPDFARMVRNRLANPEKLNITADPAALGNSILRQLEPNSAPGGDMPRRMSGLGKCARALSYSLHEVPENGSKIDGRSRANFSIGDCVEALLSTVLASVIETMDDWSLEGYREQGQVAVRLKTLNHGYVPGHPDGVLVRHYQADVITAELPADERYILEIKSASSYAFSEWQKALEREEDPWSPTESYYWQLNGYMYATDTRYAYVLVLCKDSGAITGWWAARDPDYLERLDRHLKMSAAPPQDVPRRLPCGTELGPVRKLSKKTGKPLKGDGKLAWQCHYCPWHSTCWNNLTETVGRDYRGRPSKHLYLKEEEG